MDTTTVLTLRLAEALGLYLAAAGLGGLLAPARWPAIADDLERSPALVYVAGVAAFAVGTAIVLLHCLFTDLLAIVVSLLGWGLLAEGLLLLAWPAPLLALARRLRPASRVWSAIALILGALLFLAGATGRAALIP